MTCVSCPCTQHPGFYQKAVLLLLLFFFLVSVTMDQFVNDWLTSVESFRHRFQIRQCAKNNKPTAANITASHKQTNSCFLAKPLNLAVKVDLSLFARLCLSLSLTDGEGLRLTEHLTEPQTGILLGSTEQLVNPVCVSSGCRIPR